MRGAAGSLLLASLVAAAWAEETKEAALLSASGSDPAPQTLANKDAPQEPKDGDIFKLSLEELMNIQVTSVSRQESTVGRSPAAIHVITQDDIRRSGATTIPELFRMVPGMNVARIDGNKWAVGVRGFNARFQDKLLAQVDGRTIYNEVFSGTYWDTVQYPLEDIERIEVIRGPGASVWGANAVNGIVNIITKSSKDTQGGRAVAGGGTQEQGFGEVSYGGKIRDDLTFRAYARAFHLDEQFASDGGPHDGWWNASGGARFDWQATKEDAVTLQGDYLHGDAGRKDFRAQQTAPFSFLNVEDEDTDAGNILGRWTHQLGKESSFSLQAYWDHFFRKTDGLLASIRLDTFDLDFQHNLGIGERQKIVYGVGVRFFEARLQGSGEDDGFAFSLAPKRRHRKLLSAFFQDEITLLEERLILTLGSKIEHNDYIGVEIQPTARLLWTPSKRQAAWAAISRAVRTPNLTEDSATTRLLPAFPAALRGAPLFPFVVGNRDFQSEEVIACELGYRAQATKQLSLDFALYSNSYDNLKTTQAGPAGAGLAAGTFELPLRRTNQMKGETYGAEMAATYQPIKMWRLNAAYTLLKTELHRQGSLTRSAEAAEGQSPEHQAYLQSSWNLPHNVEFDLTGRFVDRLRGFNPSGADGIPDEIPKYTTLDARVNWRARKNLDLELVGQNLIDNHHPESGTSASIRAPVVEIERAVYFKLTFRF